MRIGENKLYIGPFTRIGNAVFQNKPIKRDIRAEFRQLSFSDQAELIGCYARSQMNSADRILKKMLKHTSDDIPGAMVFWEKMMGRSAVNGLEKIRMQNNAPMVRDLWPELVEATNMVVPMFIGVYKVWVDNFYSCDENGKFDLAAHERSKASSLNDEEMRLIDKKSLMPDLGWNMRKYATERYSRAFLYYNKALSIRSVN
jgi:hypothetical protein